MLNTFRPCGEILLTAVTYGILVWGNYSSAIMFGIPSNSKPEKNCEKNHLLYAGWLTNLAQF